MNSTTAMPARYFAITTWLSLTGAVSNSSSVPARRSSAKRRMVMIGTISSSRPATWKKMWTSVAYRLLKSVRVNE
jgi:outer membrane lipoprotein SlyB